MKYGFSRLLLGALLVPAVSAFGGQLMVEQFEYSIGVSLTGSAGGSGFGGAWQTQTFFGSLTITAGLTFSDYPVAGNALTLNLTPSGFGGSLAAGARDIGDSSIPTTGGEFWASYLYRYNSGGTGGDDFRASIRNSGLTNDRFILTGRDDLLEQNGGVGIDNSDEGGTNSLQTGGVFLLIAKFTNFGNGSAGNSQTGTFWALRPQDYDVAKVGGLTEAKLALNAYSTSSDFPLTTPIGFTTADVIAINSTIGGASLGYNLTVDELRYSTDLASLVPEPTTGSLLLLGLAGIAGRRRHRK